MTFTSGAAVPWLCVAVLVAGCSGGSSAAPERSVEQAQPGGLEPPAALPEQSYRYSKIRTESGACASVAESWVGDDESGFLRITEDEAPECAPAAAPAMPETEWFPPGTWYAEGIGAPLPPDPDPLGVLLAAEASGAVKGTGWEPAVANHGVERLMHVPDLTVHRAFFGLVQRMDSVRPAGAAVDVSGRAATVLLQRFEDDGVQLERHLLFDPRTHELLEAALYEVAAGKARLTLHSRNTFLQRRVTDEPPKRGGAPTS